MGGRSGRPRVGNRARAAVRRHALGLPGAWEDFPWGDTAIKVGKKVFLFMSPDRDALSLSVKLPASSLMALDLPFTEPTGYGLARGGWVTARFEKDQTPPVDLLARWVEESYRAVAPRKLAKELDERRDPRGEDA